MFVAALVSYIAVLNCEGTGVSEQEAAYTTTSLRNAVAAGAKGQYKVMDSETIAEVVGPEGQKCFAGKCTYAIAKKLQASYGVSCSFNKVGDKTLTSIEVYSSKGDYLLGYQPYAGDTLTIAKEIADTFPNLIYSKIAEYVNKPEPKPEVKPEPKPEVKPEAKAQSNALESYCGKTFKDYILDKKTIPSKTFIMPTPFFEIEERKQQYGTYNTYLYAGIIVTKFKSDKNKEVILYGNSSDANSLHGKDGYNIDLNDSVMLNKIHKIVSDGNIMCDIYEMQRKEIAAREIRFLAERAAAEKAASEKAASEKAAAERAARVVHIEDAIRNDASKVYGGWCGWNIDKYIRSWGRKPDAVTEEDATKKGSIRYVDENYYADVYYQSYNGSKLITSVWLRSKPDSIKYFEQRACLY